MKNYEEMAKNVLRRRDEHIKAVKKRRAKAVKYLATGSAMCLAIVICAKTWHNVENKNDIMEDIIQSTDVENTALTSSSHVTHTTVSTTAVSEHKNEKKVTAVTTAESDITDVTVTPEQASHEEYTIECVQNDTEPLVTDVCNEDTAITVISSTANTKQNTPLHTQVAETAAVTKKTDVKPAVTKPPATETPVTTTVPSSIDDAPKETSTAPILPDEPYETFVSYYFYSKIPEDFTFNILSCYENMSIRLTTNLCTYRLEETDIDSLDVNSEFIETIILYSNQHEDYIKADVYTTDYDEKVAVKFEDLDFYCIYTLM